MFRLALLALLLTTAGSVVAQTRSFDPWKDLTGYEEATRGEWQSFCDVEKWRARLGLEVDAAGLARLREEWTAEKKAIDEKIVAILADPHGRSRFHLRRVLESDPYLKAVDYREIEIAPFCFVIQRPPKDDPEYYQDVADAYAGVLRDVEKDFRRLLVEPLKLTLRPKHGFFGLVILASEGSYVDFLKAHRIATVASRAHYDPATRLSVSWERSFGRGSAKHLDEEKRIALRHELVHALQWAYIARPAGKRLPVWLSEGLAEFFAYGPGADPAPDSLAALRIRNVLDLLASETGQRYLHPIPDLVEIQSYAQSTDFAKRRTQDPRAEGREVGGLYGLSYLLVEFLHEARGGAYRPRLLDLVRRLGAGEEAAAAFSGAFEGISPETLEAELIERAARLGRRDLAEFEHRSLGGGVRVGSTARPDAAVAETAPAGKRRPPLGLTPAEPVDFRFFGSIYTSPDSGRIAVRKMLAAFDIEGAERLLAPVKIQRAYEIGREAARLAKLKRAFDVVGTRAIEERWLVPVEVDGKRVHRRVQAVHDDGLELDRVGRIRWSDLGAAEFQKLGRKKKIFTGALAELDDYLRLLSDPEGARIADDAEKEIRQDAERIRADVLDPRPWLAYRRLSAAVFIDDPEVARRRLADLEEVCRDEVLVATVDREKLVEYATALLKLAFRCDAGTNYGLVRPVETTPEGRLRVSYDFADEAQLADFHFGSYPHALSDEVDLSIGGGAVPRIRALANGGLEVSGSATGLWRLPLKGRVMVSYRVAIIEVAKGKLGRLDFGAGLADDGGKSFLLASLNGSLAEFRGGVMTKVASTTFAHPRVLEDYQVTVVRAPEGGITAHVDGELASEIENTTADGGRIFLRAHTAARIRWLGLVIEGELDRENLGHARDAWVAAGLRRLGLN
ncbi:MAG: hypothetical protein R3F20_18050 [Planctomycetota bacterium]